MPACVHETHHHARLCNNGILHERFQKFATIPFWDEHFDDEDRIIGFVGIAKHRRENKFKFMFEPKLGFRNALNSDTLSAHVELIGSSLIFLNDE